MRYFSKKDEWFDEGTEAVLTADCRSFAIFVGYRNGNLDEEACSLDEFYIIEDDCDDITRV